MSGNVGRIGRVLRVRSGLETTTLYFDRLLDRWYGLYSCSGRSTLPSTGSMTRLQWSDFIAASAEADGRHTGRRATYRRPSLHSRASSARGDGRSSGPANGPHEQIVDMGVRDRYLVGKLAPREADGAEAGLKDWKGRWRPKPRKSLTSRSSSWASRAGSRIRQHHGPRRCRSRFGRRN